MYWVQTTGWWLHMVAFIILSVLCNGKQDINQSMWDINLILLVQNSILVISYFNLGGQVTNGSNLYMCDTFYIELIFLYTMQESF